MQVDGKGGEGRGGRGEEQMNLAALTVQSRLAVAHRPNCRLVLACSAARDEMQFNGLAPIRPMSRLNAATCLASL